MFDTIIIGGGYAGLTCGVILAKSGQHVCVLEKSRVLGGAFQCFQRSGLRLDTGFHYVGGVAEGEIMHPMLEMFELADLPWVRLDEEFLEVHCDDEVYRLHSGYDQFVEQLTNRFPAERKGIEHPKLNKLVEILKKELGQDQSQTRLTSMRSTENEEHIGDQRLRKLLCAQAVTTDLTPDLPLYSFIQSLNSFIQHSYRIEGGGDTIISRLRENILTLGGKVRTGCEVTAFHDDGSGKIASVECANGEVLAAQQFISTIHPALSVALMPECPQIRGIYPRRFSRMPNSRGIFTVQLAIKPDTIHYCNHVISLLGSSDPWNTDYSASAPVENLLINFNVPQKKGSRFADNIDLLTPMDFSTFDQWSDSRVGHRPDDYRQLKEAKAKECIELAAKLIPRLKDSITAIYTSTPLTYRDYTGTINGSAYGISKSASAIAGGMLSPMTPFPNLFFAGQSIMLHGMLGVGMSSLLVTNIVKKAALAH